MAEKKRSPKKKKSWFRRRFELAVLIGAVICVALATNWIYQVWRKPSELIGVFDDHFHKGPYETWDSYGSTFAAMSTNIMTPDLLAALAQAESNGNPIVRTYWKFRWTTDLTRLFAPASSAVGMFQITEGTFEEAKDFCVRDGVAVRAQESADCRGTVYSRLLPAHAIEMTAARLHWHAENLLRRYRVRRAALRDKQNLATVIHLCGLGKGERFVRTGLQLTRLGRCGDHSAASYVRRVAKLQREFKRFALRDGLLAKGE
ncbi:MAG: transglycosylase SLT domain-containing protein [Bdellovibrionaceae bacterium]|nr:transglycosylase SLT domain-containing protein [Pseudobdellovibrionaceae bacterium]